VLIPDPIEQNQIKISLSHLHFHVFGLEISSTLSIPKEKVTPIQAHLFVDIKRSKKRVKRWDTHNFLYWLASLFLQNFSYLSFTFVKICV